MFGMKPAQLKGFLDELSKIEDKPVSKELNKLLFRKSEEEVLMEHPELQPPPPEPAPAPQPGQEEQTQPPGQKQQPEAPEAAPEPPEPAAKPAAPEPKKAKKPAAQAPK